MARLHLDSNIVIRLVEGGAGTREALASRIAALSGTDSPHVVSDLVYMECPVKP